MARRTGCRIQWNERYNRQTQRNKHSLDLTGVFPNI